MSPKSIAEFWPRPAKNQTRKAGKKTEEANAR